MANYPLIGAAIMTGFALCWAIIGSRQLRSLTHRSRATWAAILVTLFVGGILYWSTRFQSPPQYSATSFNGRLYTAAVVFEAVAIPLAVILCRRGGRKDRILPLIAGIVGLHFFGLAAAIVGSQTVFISSGLAMTALAAMALWRVDPASTHFWAMTIGWGCALILWASALSIVCD